MRLTDTGSSAHSIQLHFMSQLSSNVERLEGQLKENQALRSRLEGELQQSREGKEDSVSATPAPYPGLQVVI